MDHAPIEFENTIPAQLRERYADFNYVGQGGMGRIVSAVDTVLQKAVAIKILPPTVVSETAVTRFQIEAKAVSKLNHPNVVQVLDFGFASSGEPYLVMEYVQGQTLDSLIEKHGKLPLRMAISLAIQICSAIQHAHHNGIVHRDLKPGNIMLDEEKNVKVLDFGLAKIVDQSSVDWRITKPGSAIGSPLYMSPEQLRGEDVDVRTDVYSLALVIYKMATGEVPMEDGNLMAMLMARFHEAPPVLPPCEENLALGEALSEIIVKALQADRDERTADVSQLKEELLALSEIPDPKKDVQIEDPLWYQNKLFIKVFGIPVALLSLVGLCILAPTVMEKFNPVVVKGHGLEFEPTSDKTKKDDEVTPGFILKRDPMTDEVTWFATSYATDSDLNYLKSRGVNFLRLQSNRHFTVEGIKTVAKFPIRRLYLRETTLGDEIVPYINEMKDLQLLDLRATRITNAGVLKLKPSKALVDLNLCDQKTVSNSGLAHIVKAFPNLVSLGLSNTSVTGEGLKQLKLLRLTSVALAVLKLTDADMETIARLGPQRIEVESNPITDKGLDALLKIPKITYLSVEFCDKISMKKLHEFAQKYPRIAVREPFPKKDEIDDTMEFFETPEPAPLDSAGQ